LQTNLDLIDDFLKNNPIGSVADLAKLERVRDEDAPGQPLIATSPST
jgi:hypothetical protein